MKVRLRSPIWVDTKWVPAGTVCHVEQYYPTNQTYDLVADESLFWALAKEVIPLLAYGDDNVANRQ